MHGYTQGIYEYLKHPIPCFIPLSRHGLKNICSALCAFAFQEYIAQRSPDFRKTFVKFDSDGDGKISRKEFRMVCVNLVLFKRKNRLKVDD